TSNNQAKYETFIIRLHMTLDLRAIEVQLFNDYVLQLAPPKSRDFAKLKSPCCKNIWTKLIKAKVHHILKEQNGRANILTKQPAPSQ
ncbi:hypothetical protein CR513_16703, partial [Mucuna pruriens]